MDRPKPPTRTREIVTASIKGALSSLPFVGGILSEVVFALIPDLRAERIEKLFAVLEARLRHLEPSLIEERMREPEQIDVFEDAVQSAARALTEERIGYIGAVLAKSISDEQRNYLRHKRVLYLLAQLNEAEIIILTYYGFGLLRYPGRADERKRFQERHRSVLARGRASLRASGEEHDAAAIHNSHTDHLVNLGLLVPRFVSPTPRKTFGGKSELDGKTGKLKSSGVEITRLGEAVLKEIDAFGNEDGDVRDKSESGAST